jgi:hypothetical protein
MPSLPHELTLALFRECPELASYLLREVLGVPLPRYTEVRVEEADFTQIAPIEFRADLVLTLRDKTPVLGVVLEMQRKMDERKRYTWLVYVAVLRARIEKDVVLLVITDDVAVAAWAAAPIVSGPGSVQAVYVIGPKGVPWVRTAEEARRLPELAVLSALAHGNEPAGLEVLLPTLEAVAALDEGRKKFYTDAILVALNEATRQALEKEMQTGKYEYKSEFARSYIAQGRAEGEAKGEAKALLTLLAARGIEVDDKTRETILSCTDLEQLDRWIVRSANASSLADVLTET